MHFDFGNQSYGIVSIIKMEQSKDILYKNATTNRLKCNRLYYILQQKEML